MAKIKTNDEIIVIAGKDKGKRGKVLKVADGRVTVAGIAPDHAESILFIH